MIKKSNYTNFAIIILLQIISFKLSAQIVSPFNKLEIKDTTSSYTFIVSGHFHGASTNASKFPAASLQANIDTLNSLKPSFLICLGDMFLDMNETYLEHYQKSLFNKLHIPLLNAVGNHDLANGNMYEKVFGKTYFSFTLHSELFIVLNTEMNDGSIKDEQLKFFKSAVNTAKDNNIKNVFVFSHRPVWTENNEKYSKLFADNTHSTFENNFSKEIIPLLKSISKDKNVYWMSGSMGGMAPVSFFYDKDKATNITFMQTAIRDLPRDAVLKVNVNNGIISFDGISFTGQTLQKIESYNLEYWNKSFAPEQKFSFRMLPYLTKQMLMHQYFWFGFVFCFILLFVFSFIKRRWKRNK